MCFESHRRANRLIRMRQSRLFVNLNYTKANRFLLCSISPHSKVVHIKPVSCDNTYWAVMQLCPFISIFSSDISVFQDL